ncbi:MAG: YIP1 family protein [Marinilabiliaceae bacterium]|nr:YIP1 family protein [Marinilabiliaceae bacterium]
MNTILSRLLSLNKWYSFIVVAVYGCLFAEYISEIATYNIIIDQGGISEILKVFLGVNFIITITSTMVVWVVFSLLFHIVALLLDGQGKYNDLLRVSSYTTILPSIAVAVAIFMLDEVYYADFSYMPSYEDVSISDELMSSLNIINYTYISYYILNGVVVKFLYKLSWVKAILSILIPIVSIWGVSELFDM